MDTQAEAPSLRGLTACYSRAGGVELRGAGPALLSLCELLTSDQTPGVRRLEVSPGRSPEPFEAFLTAVRVERGEGPTRVGVEGSTLLVSGPREGLGLLADNIAWVAEQAGSTAASSTHLHVEHYPGHPFLSPDSEPLVVVRDLHG